MKVIDKLNDEDNESDKLKISAELFILEQNRPNLKLKTNVQISRFEKFNINDIEIKKKIEQLEENLISHMEDALNLQYQQNIIKEHLFELNIKKPSVSGPQIRKRASNTSYQYRPKTNTPIRAINNSATPEILKQRANNTKILTSAEQDIKLIMTQYKAISKKLIKSAMEGKRIIMEIEELNITLEENNNQIEKILKNITEYITEESKSKQNIHAKKNAIEKLTQNNSRRQSDINSLNERIKNMEQLNRNKQNTFEKLKNEIDKLNRKTIKLIDEQDINKDLLTDVIDNISIQLYNLDDYLNNPEKINNVNIDLDLTYLIKSCRNDLKKLYQYYNIDIDKFDEKKNEMLK